MFAVNLSNCNPIRTTDIDDNSNINTTGNNITSSSSILSKRRKNYNGQATFYTVGLGACGHHNNNNQHVAAISHGLFDSIPSPNPNKNKFCGKKARIFRGKKSVVVTIVDRCGGCNYEDIAFNKIAKPSEGRVNRLTHDWKNKTKKKATETENQCKARLAREREQKHKRRVFNKGLGLEFVDKHSNKENNMEKQQRFK
ncbi:4136_t:CDS:2 [Diversispora eburnea]|uniref:4136_t:CDS:1 n=1 Tax=Diversispora eburnea TaxID=1213867 RepID=A0A9N8V025_9GLOM|nr:4136_t:CDS:2 [Diversispora eburnea]